MSNYNIVDISEKFNKNIKKLINILNQSITNNILLDTIKRRIKIVIDTDPLFLIEQGGVHIFNYREYIKNEQIEELLFNYDQVIQSNKDAQEYLNGNANEAEDINKLLGLLKNVWNTYGDEEKKIVNKIFKILLSEYCKYLSIKN
jgi:hypothetical protein